MRGSPTQQPDYFVNHDRRNRFPWSLYHQPISKAIGATVRAQGPAPTVLVVGCGLEPYVPGVPTAVCHGCDVDERAVEACKKLFPAVSDRIGLCPSAYELPSGSTFAGPFDAVVAKDVVEHLTDPLRWVRLLAGRVAVGGELVLSTPNYGAGSTLNLIERTVLEAIARIDGYSRGEIHPSRFDAKKLAALELGETMKLVGVVTTWNRWSLVGRWKRLH